MNTALSAEARAPYLIKLAELNQESSSTWLGAARRAAFDAFVRQGWPSPKQEEWRFTDVTPITERELLPVPRLPAPGELGIFDPHILGLGGEASPRLVFVDGRYHSARGMQDETGAGLRLLGLPLTEVGADPQLATRFGRHLRNHNAFVALNTMFVNDAVFVVIPPGLRCEQPIYVFHLASATEGASFPRTLVVAGPDSEATVVEVHLGAEGRATLSNAVTEIMLEPGARLAYHAIQKSGAQGIHVGHVVVHQDTGSAFSGHGLVLDGRLVRRDVQVLLAGEGCRCDLDGLYLVDGNGHVDNQSTIDHSQPRSTSREDFRGAVTGKGHAVFAGRVVVRPGASKTDAQQSNRNLLLSDEAQIDSKPELEIMTSDVKCSHGATTGRLDPEARFYLRARGLDAQSADRMLIRAFLQQSVERVAAPQVRAELGGLLERRIDELMVAGGRP